MHVVDTTEVDENRSAMVTFMNEFGMEEFDMKASVHIYMLRFAQIL